MAQEPGKIELIRDPYGIVRVFREQRDVHRLEMALFDALPRDVQVRLQHAGKGTSLVQVFLNNQVPVHRIISFIRSNLFLDTMGLSIGITLEDLQIFERYPSTPPSTEVALPKHILEDVKIAGMNFVPGSRPRFDEAVEIIAERDPDNQYHSNAIALTVDGAKIGFIPRATADELAPLMDNGIELRVTKGVEPYTVTLDWDADDDEDENEDEEDEDEDEVPTAASALPADLIGSAMATQPISGSGSAGHDPAMNTEVERGD